MPFDFETNATAIDYGYGTKYQPGYAVLAGAELHIKTAPCIIEGLHGLVDAGYFNWTASDDALYLEAIVRWMAEERNFKIESDWIVPSYGTLQTICSAIRAFSEPGDGVIIQQPVYLLYHRAIGNTGRTIVNNALIETGGHYRMDFEDLEAKMSMPENKLMILCNPHNPLMDFWERDDLERLAQLADRYKVLVISDEIFAEHVLEERDKMLTYGSLALARENCIICTSLGKAFNFTGTSHANAIIENAAIRVRYIEQRNADHYGSLSPFMRTALLSAYTAQGKAWLCALRAFIEDNAQYVHDFFQAYMPMVKVMRHRAGALLWVDFRGLGLEEAGIEALFKAAHIAPDLGSKYGAEGSGFIRLLIGVPKQELKDALDRLLKVYQEKYC